MSCPTSVLQIGGREIWVIGFSISAWSLDKATDEECRWMTELGDWRNELDVWTKGCTVEVSNSFLWLKLSASKEICWRWSAKIEFAWSKKNSGRRRSSMIWCGESKSESVSECVSRRRGSACVNGEKRKEPVGYRVRHCSPKALIEKNRRSNQPYPCVERLIFHQNDD